MGPMEVPEDALYGASTQRAVLNFPVSGQPMPSAFIHALGLVKWACAEANAGLGRLEAGRAGLIAAAALAVARGEHDGQFPVDVFQTGSGTSTNMNANEVIANLCALAAGRPIGGRDPVHPNDHVNLGQSSNDVIPTTLHVAVAVSLRDHLLPGLETLREALTAKAESWRDLVKIGRTHLMDATPVTLGQEFGGYARQVEKGIARVRRAIYALTELAIGGTAVGTGLNGHPEFAPKVCALLSARTGLTFREAKNHFEAQGARDDCVEVAGHLATVAASLAKIAHDIRLLGSGPRSGLGELNLPATQPGSSIMPGKVNPVMSEMLVQATHYTQGMSQVVVACGRDGQLELNVTLPLLAKCLLDSIQILGNASGLFAERCVAGLEANEAQCRRLVDRSLMLVTALNPHLGYDQSAMVAKRAYEENKTLREVVLELGLLDAATLDAALDPLAMVRPKGDAP
jgi:fumarate hydratase, class II